MADTGDMLRLGRQLKGYTQKLAAQRLGVTQPVLSRFENSASEPEEPLLMIASKVYEVPRAFFDIRDAVYGPSVSVHPMPRAKASITARDLDMVTAELNIRSMQLRRFLDGVDFAPTNDLPALDVENYGNGAKVAALLRAHWQLPTGPIKNLTTIVERAGCIVAHSSFGGASVSGMTFKVPGSPPLILLNSDHPADRMRFTLAHELGHVVMHRFPTPTMENEANDFASAFLMPAEQIAPYFKGRNVTLELLASLKPEWRCSMQMTLRVAKNGGFVSENQYRYLMMQISKRGWRLREPPELDFPHEQPQILRAVIKAHVEELGYSIDDVIKFFPMHDHQFNSYYGDVFGKSERPRLRIVS